MSERVIDGYTLWTGSEKAGVAGKWFGCIGVKSNSGDAQVHSIEPGYDDPIEADRNAEARLRDVNAVTEDLELVF